MLREIRSDDLRKFRREPDSRRDHIGKTAAESKPQGAGPAGTGTKAETSVK